MEGQWQRIVAWLEANAPASAAELGPPATDADIGGLIHELGGMDVPDVLERWLRISNGAPDIFPFGYRFLDCEGIAHRHFAHLRAADGNEDYWQPAWIPVLELPEAGYWGYALDTSAPGCPVLTYQDGRLPEVTAPSLAALLARYADALEAGRWDVLRAVVDGGHLVWREE